MSRYAARVDPLVENIKDSSTENSVQDADIIEQIKFSLNFLAQVYESDKSTEFATYRLKSSTPYTAVLLCIVQSFFGFWRSAYISEPGVPTLLKLANYVKLIVPFLGWMYIYLYSQYEQSEIKRLKDGRRIIILGNICIILQSFFTGLLSIVWVITKDHCSAEACLEEFPEKIIPLGLLFHQICGGVAMPLFYSCHDVFSIILSIVISYSAMLVTAILLHMDNVDVVYIFLTALVISMVLAKYECGIFSNFFSFSRFEIALREQISSENKECVLKMQTEEMRHMIGNVAHDLRTPLQAFQSELEFVREKVEESMCDSRVDDSQLASVKQLCRIVNFMNMTINRSIDFAKASSGLKLIHSVESVNLMAAIDWVTGCVATSQENVPIVVTPLPPSIHNHIYTDKHWLLENLLCLISNAQKYTSEGTITVRCSLRQTACRQPVRKLQSGGSISIGSSIDTGRCTDADSCAEVLHGTTYFLYIDVEDTGIGVSAENRDLLFKPLVQAGRSAGGTGLGLYALSKRMESLGGKCGVKDPVSGARGSCFWFAIPYKPNDTISSQKSLSDEGTTDSVRVDLNRCVNNELEKSLDDEQSAIVAQFISQQTLSSDSEVTSTLSTNRFSLRVLLVDDSGLIRKGMSRSLAKDGHQVQVAQHGAEAVKILTASRAASETGEFGFDLILMDLQMPVMDGLEATKRIREMESHASSENGGKESSRIMIVGISANTAGEVKHDCLECGMDGFMEKPVRMKHIREFFSLYSSRTSQKSASNM